MYIDLRQEVEIDLYFSWGTLLIWWIHHYLWGINRVTHWNLIIITEYRFFLSFFLSFFVICNLGLPLWNQCCEGSVKVISKWRTSIHWWYLTIMCFVLDNIKFTVAASLCGIVYSEWFNRVQIYQIKIQCLILH